MNVWKRLTNFRGILFPSKEEYLRGDCTSTSKKNESGFHNEDEDKNKDRRAVPENEAMAIRTSTGTDTDNGAQNKILRYRVTCYRTGHHSFGSQDAARSFGGRLQDLYNWVVNLSDYELDVVLKIDASTNFFNHARM